MFFVVFAAFNFYRQNISACLNDKIQFALFLGIIGDGLWKEL
jgi:hypothetical protein